MPIKAKKPTGTPKKTVKKSVVKVDKEKTVKKSSSSMLASVYSDKGKEGAEITLEKSVFGVKVPSSLLAQAVRIHLSNQRSGSASTKGRGEVEGSTRKIYKQKGTGNARHGGIRAPIFVGGGIAFGPKPHSFRLKFPDSMKKQSLRGALSMKHAQNELFIVADSKDLPHKTREMASLFETIGIVGKTLFVTPKSSEETVRAVRNLKNVDVLGAEDVHTYALIAHKTVVCTKDSLSILTKRLEDSKI
jgi:large subunit ribosomal protein L4